MKTGPATLTERILAQTIQFIVWAVAIASECSIPDIVETQTPYLLKANECAPLDFGLAEVPPDLQRYPAPERCFQLVKRHPKHSKSVGGLDFKCYSLLGCGGGRRPQNAIHNAIHVSAAQQRLATALLVYLPATPRQIRVVPTWFFDYTFNYAERRDLVESIGSTYHSRIANRAPSVWDAFSMPLSHLGEDLNGMWKFFQGQQTHWSNTFYQWPYENCPRPQLCEMRELVASGIGIEPDIWWIDDVCAQFSVHAQYYDARMLTIRPGVGDFAFIRRATGDMYAAEVKRTTAWISSRGEICCRSRFGDDIEATVRGRYFSALVPVDVYLLELHAPQWGWLLLPQHVLPDSWFDGSLEDRQKRGTFLKWKSPDDPDFIAKHHIRANPGDGVRFVARAEEIMNQYPDLRANLHRPFCLPRMAWDVEEPSHKDRGVDSSDSEDVESTRSRKQAADGKKHARSVGMSREQWSQLVFESMEAGRYNRQCETLGWGAFYPLQAHPAESYVFTPFLNEEFATGKPETPFVKVHFACVCVVDSLVAITEHDRSSFERALRAGERSIFVLAPSHSTGGWNNGAMREQATIRYVVPSEQLVSDQLVRKYRRIRERGTAIGHPVQLSLREGELIDVYAIPVDMVVFKLLELFQQLDGDGRMFFGVDYEFGTGRLRCGSTINVAQYLFDQASVLKDWVGFLQTAAEPQDSNLKTGLPKRMTRHKSPRTCVMCRTLKLPCSLNASKEERRCDRCEKHGKECVIPAYNKWSK